MTDMKQQDRQTALLQELVKKSETESLSFYELCKVRFWASELGMTELYNISNNQIKKML